MAADKARLRITKSQAQSDDRTRDKLPHKAKWAFDDIEDIARDLATGPLRTAIHQAAREKNLDLMEALAKLAEGLGRIERKARDGQEGHYEDDGGSEP